MEPVRAHGLVPVAPDVSIAKVERGANSRVAGGRARPRVSGGERVVPGENHWPTVVVELSWEEEGLGEAVALRRIVTIVLVGAEGVEAETKIRSRVDGQPVVVAQEDGLAVPHAQELRREGPIKGPEGQRILDWEIRVELDRDASRRPGSFWNAGGIVVELAGCPLAGLVLVELERVPGAAVGAGEALKGVDVGLRVELCESLMGPVLSWRAALRGRSHEGSPQEGLDLRLPGVLFATPVVRVVGFPGGEGMGEGEARRDKLIQEAIEGTCTRATVRIRRGREVRAGQDRRLCAEWDWTELLVAKHLLSEGSGTEQRARLCT